MALLAPLLLLSAGLLAGAASAPGAPGTAPLSARRLLQQPAPKEAYYRKDLAGAAAGRAAGGVPPVAGLTSADAPVVGRKAATMEDLVLTRGYPLESYPVETTDGFILRMYRIPHGKANATGPGPKPVVLLHHGVTLASSSFVVLDPTSSHGFRLADAGFDVWMVNTRGNTYSNGNRNLQSSQAGYWAFSLDELALIDLPAQIDFALSKTGQKSLAIVGHSQGCTLPVMLLAAKPEYNDRVWLLAAEAPVFNAQYMKASFLRQQAETMSATVLQDAGIGKFVPSTIMAHLPDWCGGQRARVSKESTRGAAGGARSAASVRLMCYDLSNFLFAGDSALSSPDDFDHIMSVWPAAVSTRNLLHWAQMFKDGRGLQMFDFGTDCGAKEGGPRAYYETCNQAKYGQADPPLYEVANVRVKVALLRGAKDQVGTAEDIATMLRAWRAQVVFDQTYAGVAHMDFVFARTPPGIAGDLIDCLWNDAPRVTR